MNLLPRITWIPDISKSNQIVQPSNQNNHSRDLTHLFQLRIQEGAKIWIVTIFFVKMDDHQN